MEYGMVVYVVTLVLSAFLALAGIYFLIYKWHINRAIKKTAKYICRHWECHTRECGL